MNTGCLSKLGSVISFLGGFAVEKEDEVVIPINDKVSLGEALSTLHQFTGKYKFVFKVKINPKEREELLNVSREWWEFNPYYEQEVLCIELEYMRVKKK